MSNENVWYKVLNVILYDVLKGFFMTIDELFLRDEKRTKKLYDTELLAKLLLLNFEFSNNRYLGRLQSYFVFYVSELVANERN